MHKLLLAEKFVAAEIDIINREREIRLDQPLSIIMDQMLTATYGRQHLGRLPVGEIKELKTIRLADLQKYYKTWYAPNIAKFLIIYHNRSYGILNRF